MSTFIHAVGQMNKKNAKISNNDMQMYTVVLTFDITLKTF